MTSVFPMDSSFNEFSKVVTKYVLGSQERFNELKERTEAIFAAIYKWLDGRLEEEGYFDDEGTSRSVLHEAFDIYMVS